MIFFHQSRDQARDARASRLGELHPRYPRPATAPRYFVTAPRHLVSFPLLLTRAFTLTRSLSRRHATTRARSVPSGGKFADRIAAPPPSRTTRLVARRAASGQTSRRATRRVNGRHRRPGSNPRPRGTLASAPSRPAPVEDAVAAALERLIETRRAALVARGVLRTDDRGNYARVRYAEPTPPPVLDRRSPRPAPVRRQNSSAGTATSYDSTLAAPGRGRVSRVDRRDPHREKCAVGARTPTRTRGWGTRRRTCLRVCLTCLRLFLPRGPCLLLRHRGRVVRPRTNTASPPVRTARDTSRRPRPGWRTRRWEASARRSGWSGPGRRAKPLARRLADARGGRRAAPSKTRSIRRTTHRRHRRRRTRDTRRTTARGRERGARGGARGGGKDDAAGEGGARARFEPTARRGVFSGGGGAFGAYRAAEATSTSREVRGEGSKTQKSVLTMSLRREAERR